MQALLTLSLVLASNLSPQDPGATAPVGDTRVVDFFLPSQFEGALAAAAERKRFMLIKGVAFGVDAEGARCATKGHW